MRTTNATLVYTSARILLLVLSLLVLHFGAGLGGLSLWVFAFAVSMLLSYVLLSRQRDAMSGAITSRLEQRRQHSGGGLRARLEEGARMEDDDEDELQAADHHGTVSGD